MKRFFTPILAAFVGLSLVSCEFDANPLWQEIDGVKERVDNLEVSVNKNNNDIAALQTIIEALQKNVYVTAVNTTSEGYTISFSDGKTATLSNGKDGAAGVNAPAISVAKDGTDGNYYWTLDGEWLMVDGQRVRANGTDGKDGANGNDGQDGVDGADAVAPQVRINPLTKIWEISIDGGKTWESTDVVAEGKNGTNGSDGADGDDGAAGDSMFKAVDCTNPDYVIVVLADNTVIKLARYDESAPRFEIENAAERLEVEYGKSVELEVTTANVADYTINLPEGWKATFADDLLTVTAPAKDLCHYDKEGVLAVTVVSQTGRSAIAKLGVMAGEWVTVEEYEVRTLTFEDVDAKFTSYALEPSGKPIEKWSDLVDDAQYGGTLTYGDYSGGDYYWYDEGNTELFHSFVTPYWGGGHVISNYVIEDFATLPEGNNGWYELQMCTPMGGNRGSANFAVHNGYSDFFNSQIYDASLQGFEFADGVERVVESMYVTNTNYMLNSLCFGDGFNQPANESTWIKLVAYGYNSSDELTGTSEFLLCKGAEDILVEWAKWDLSSLGKVAKITFNFEASEDQIGQYGMNCPAYFAYDDVAVKFASQMQKFE
ncbi:MAG: DUF4465 domain-containing protein [Rikenellaceae bacterium]|nr:DUF4465 domain-containing protein [Rikenellaceae bacterium]